MIAIVIGIIFVVIIVAIATVFLMKFNDTKRIKALKSEANSQSKVMVFTERNYKGDKTEITVGDDDSAQTVNLHVKSFMIPSGYKFRTFPKSDQMGSPFTYPGPAYVKNTDKTIASFIVFKGMLDEPQPPGDL
tara:strand:+ start:699 stop:1097 length:399 start_codon:yes stop_codon:yes gene_type:complete